mgnify:CR=1 FL=1|jgi:hypothetical protein|tara:strand:- start:605 stop:850 length:246 start_codon:yes stop_codon:yes gene_type:complete
MNRLENKGRRKFNIITSILTFILALGASVVFWVFIYRGDVYDSWYPLIGHFVASHGALIGIVIWEYLRITGKSFREIFKKK